MTNFTIMQPLASPDLIVAGNDTSCKIYNYNGQLISNEDVELIGASSTGADGSTAMVYWVDVKAIHNNKWLIIRNKQHKYGLLRNDGSLLLPFNYFSISKSSIENEIITIENEDG